MSEELKFAGEVTDLKEIGSKPEDEVKRWLKEIDLATEEEKEWRADVETALKVYVGEEGERGTKFNVYHANIQTIIPALYNSTPDPDVRRRHGDRDPIAKASADVLERILSHEIDAYDFDGVIDATVQDMAIAGRGVARVSYRATTAATEMRDEATGEAIEDVSYQSVSCAYVPWAAFRRGPGRVFEDLPWVAFAAYYTKDGLRALSGKGVEVDKIALDMRLGDEDEGAEGDKPGADIFKRALVWEIWDKDRKRVLFVCPGYKDRPLRIEDDPLGLEQFFPVPKPVQGAKRPGSLIPICEHKLTKTLLDELDRLTERITALVSQLRVRGMVAGGEGTVDLTRWAQADDGELVEAANLGAIMDKGSIENLIAWFPLDPTVKTVQQLYEQREMVKQSIYEATGIADILRGQTDPNETLGAQQIKQNWGSLRIQKRQQEVQRFIRDLLRLKAEIIANKFTAQNLILASGLDQDPQFMTPDPQTGMMVIDQVVKLLRQDVLRSYRVDIETDSTIRGDLTKNQTAMSQFVMGSGQYFQAIAPAVQAGAVPMEAAITIYSAFARNFKLGKQVDDILDKMADEAGKQGQQQQPNPEAEKMQMEMEKMKMEMAGEQQKTQAQLQAMMAKIGMEKEAKGAELQFKQQEHQMDMQAKQEDRQFERQTAMEDRVFDLQGQRMELAAKAAQARNDLAFKQATGQQALQLNAQKARQRPNGPQGRSR